MCLRETNELQKKFQYSSNETSLENIEFWKLKKYRNLHAHFFVYIHKLSCTRYVHKRVRNFFVNGGVMQSEVSGVNSSWPLLWDSSVLYNQNAVIRHMSIYEPFLQHFSCIILSENNVFRTDKNTAFESLESNDYL